MTVSLFVVPILDAPVDPCHSSSAIGEVLQ